MAEVLITLAIIGVVAAITLPLLISSYKKFIVKNQIKRTYNFISNAVNAVAMDDEIPHSCYYALDEDVTVNSDCKDFFKAVISKLNVEKYCQSNAYLNGCIPDYNDDNFPYLSSCGGFQSIRIKEDNQAALLKNGVIIFQYKYPGQNFAPIIAFDINGFSKPNRPGEDVFAIGLMADKNRYPQYGINSSKNVTMLKCLKGSSKTYYKYLRDILN